MTIQGMRTIRAYGQELVHQDRFEKASASARDIAARLVRLSAFITPLTEIVYLLVLCVVILVANVSNVGFATTLAAVALLYRLQPHLRELENSLLNLAQVESRLHSIRSMLSPEDTHRLDSITDADHVVCIEEGHVYEEGSPQTLLANVENRLSRYIRH